FEVGLFGNGSDNPSSVGPLADGFEAAFPGIGADDGDGLVDADGSGFLVFEV
ncbi:hypothetical protein HK100_004888, partial [Physocladia obscura]